jgi:hypothetical protein
MSTTRRKKTHSKKAARSPRARRSLAMVGGMPNSARQAMRVAVPAERDAEADDRALTEIRLVLDISEAQLADLFAIQRSSVEAWRKNGIPTARRAKVERLRDLVRVFVRDLKRSRIPEIVRTPDAWLDGRSILETIRIAGPDAVYSYLARLFSYSASA